MIQKKLSAIDRLTLATGVVEKINDNLRQEKNKFEESLKTDKVFQEELEKRELEFKELTKEAYNLLTKMYALEAEQDKVYNRLGILIRNAPSNYTFRNKPEYLYIKDNIEYILDVLKRSYIKEAKLKEPLDEYKIKSLINKGQSLALLAEDQDPQAIDKMLMEKLSKQI